jgi:hypothetical protein
MRGMMVMVAAAVLAFSAVEAQAAERGPAWQAYFRADHPGPGWVLEHRAVLHLSAGQVRVEERLRRGMAVAVRREAGVARAAQARYRAEAARTAPRLRIAAADADAVGVAQARLVTATMAFRLRAYAVLTRPQQAIFRRLLRRRA